MVLGFLTFGKGFMPYALVLLGIGRAEFMGVQKGVI